MRSLSLITTLAFTAALFGSAVYAQQPAAAAAGGIPIVVDGKIIGAIGVSGSPTGLIDAQAAEAGAAALK